MIQVVCTVSSENDEGAYARRNVNPRAPLPPSTPPLLYVNPVFHGLTPRDQGIVCKVYSTLSECYLFAPELLAAVFSSSFFFCFARRASASLECNTRSSVMMNRVEDKVVIGADRQSTRTPNDTKPKGYKIKNSRFLSLCQIRCTLFGFLLVSRFLLGLQTVLFSLITA
ncbi:hypothetical protein PM082_013897 [Marasmius tenuissimus]|nr:hypothetical protein PM082_013897 [Marasmius tenuissimus]